MLSLSHSPFGLLRVMDVSNATGCLAHALVQRDGSFALVHIRSKGVCRLFLPGIEEGSPFQASVLNWWEQTITPIAGAAVNGTVDLLHFEVGAFGSRLPCNLELRTSERRP